MCEEVTPTPDLAAIVRKLGADQCHAIKLMVAEWEAGPRLSEDVLDHLYALRNHGLVDRQFADDTPITFTDCEDGLTARVSACWWFRLTPLGEQVAAHLQDPANAL